MSKTVKFSTLHVPDEGIWYTPGEAVRLDESRRQVLIIKDPAGDYEVHSCRHATEYSGTPTLLRVGLRKGSPLDRSDPPPPFKPYAV